MPLRGGCCLPVSAALDANMAPQLICALVFLLCVPTLSASTYSGKREFQYTKTIDASVCPYRKFNKKIVAPEGWYFEHASDALCDFRVVRNRATVRQIDDIYIHVMPNDSEQSDWPVEQIRDRMTKLGAAKDLTEIASYSEGKSVVSRSFIQTNIGNTVTRIDQFKIHEFDLIVLTMSATSQRKLNTSRKIYADLVHMFLNQDLESSN